MDDGREVMQDFIAPDLRAADSLTLRKRLEQQIDRRFEQILGEIRSLSDVHQLELCLASYEAMLPSSSITIASG